MGTKNEHAAPKGQKVSHVFYFLLVVPITNIPLIEEAPSLLLHIIVEMCNVNLGDYNWHTLFHH